MCCVRLFAVCYPLGVGDEGGGVVVCVRCLLPGLDREGWEGGGGGRCNLHVSSLCCISYAMN